jgi:hypothetical protein
LNIFFLKYQQSDIDCSKSHYRKLPKGSGRGHKPVHFLIQGKK